MSETRTMIDRVVAIDEAVTQRVARYRDRPAIKAAGTLAELADQPPLIALSVATALAGAAMRRPALVRGGLRMLAAHLVATGIKTAIKRSVDRSRPKRALDTGDDRFEPGDTHDHDLNSFPSGHLAGAVAVARAAAHEIGGTAWPGAIVTGAVAVAQAPAGNHYLTDMAAGAAIGWMAEAAVGLAFDRISAGASG